MDFCSVPEKNWSVPACKLGEERFNGTFRRHNSSSKFLFVFKVQLEGIIDPIVMIPVVSRRIFSLHIKLPAKVGSNPPLAIHSRPAPGQS